MSLKKYVEIYQRLHLLIERQATGTPAELAIKMGVSQRQTANYVRDLRDLGDRIEFNPSVQSYVFVIDPD
jgi:predicted transcriptional regulator